MSQDGSYVARFLAEFRIPEPEFSQAPFWFWNDDLSEEEIARQMADFRSHGVYGFVIHPRAGLPRSIGWMSGRMLEYIRFAVEEASRTGMWVVLYDEGMYPSGSSAGQVVAADPGFRPHGLFCIDSKEFASGERPRGEALVAMVERANGDTVSIVDREIKDGYSVIRGLHFVEDDPPRRADKKEVAEHLPPVADILNPEAMACFIRLVYQRYFDELGEHFGKTIVAIFTDEPSFLGKRSEPGAVPGNSCLLAFVSDRLGYDFTPHLPALWFDDEPDAALHRLNYQRALQARLEETYYRPLSQWCESHDVALTGHPADPDDIGQLKYFQIPGQDIVLRYIEPGGESALAGPQSTQGKCASSAMIHQGRRRNGNEYCGAYGHNFTFEEMKWLANWLLIRGCNMLYPHAFYYSVRGPRIDERPPDVGPNSEWWDRFKPFADATSRICRLNADSEHVCSLAILGLSDYLPWKAARVCFEHQHDFNYLEVEDLFGKTEVSEDGIVVGSMCYRGLIVESDVPIPATSATKRLEEDGRIIRWREGEGEEPLLAAIGKLLEKDVRLEPACPGVRVRHVVKDGVHCYLLFNEGTEDISADIELSEKGRLLVIDQESGESGPCLSESRIHLSAFEMKLVIIERDT